MVEVITAKAVDLGEGFVVISPTPLIIPSVTQSFLPPRILSVTLPVSMS